MIWKQNPPENIWSSSHNARAPTENFEIVMSLNSWKKRLRWGLAWNGFILEMIWRVKSEGGRGEWNGKRKSQWGVLDWVCCKEMGPQRALVQNASLRGGWALISWLPCPPLYIAACLQCFILPLLLGCLCPFRHFGEALRQKGKDVCLGMCARGWKAADYASVCGWNQRWGRGRDKRHKTAAGRKETSTYPAYTVLTVLQSIQYWRRESSLWKNSSLKQHRRNDRVGKSVSSSEWDDVFRQRSVGSVPS